jgi:hypothetical protein
MNKKLFLLSFEVEGYTQDHAKNFGLVRRGQQISVRPRNRWTGPQQEGGAKAGREGEGAKHSPAASVRSPACG